LGGAGEWRRRRPGPAAGLLETRRSGDRLENQAFDDGEARSAVIVGVRAGNQIDKDYVYYLLFAIQQFESRIGPASGSR